MRLCIACIAWHVILATSLISLAAGAPPSPTVDEVLSSLATVFGNFSPVRCKVDCKTYVHTVGVPTTRVGPRQVLLCEQEWSLRSDGNRWRIEEVYRSDGEVSNESREVLSQLVHVTGEPNTGWTFDVQVSKGEPRVKGVTREVWGVYADPDATGQLPEALRLGAGSFLLGYLGGDAMRSLIDVIRDSRVTIAEGEKGPAAGKTWVLKSVGRYGTHTIWVDREAGFRPTRIDVEKQGGDLSDDRPISSFDGSTNDGKLLPKSQLLNCLRSIRPIEYQVIDGKSLITGFVETMTYSYANGGKLVLTANCKVSDVETAPDFSSADFELGVAIPDGTAVSVANAEGIRHEWRNGNVVRAFTRPDDAAAVSASGDSIVGPLLLVAGNVAVVLVLAILLIRRSRAARA